MHVQLMISFNQRTERITNHLGINFALFIGSKAKIPIPYMSITVNEIINVILCRVTIVTIMATMGQLEYMPHPLVDSTRGWGWGFLI